MLGLNYIMVEKVTMITIPFHSMSSDVPCLSCAMLAMYKRYDNRLFLSAAARLMRMVTADSYHLNKITRRSVICSSPVKQRSWLVYCHLTEIPTCHKLHSLLLYMLIMLVMRPSSPLCAITWLSRLPVQNHRCSLPPEFWQYNGEILQY